MTAMPEPSPSRPAPTPKPGAKPASQRLSPPPPPPAEVGSDRVRRDEDSSRGRRPGTASRVRPAEGSPARGAPPPPPATRPAPRSRPAPPEVEPKAETEAAFEAVETAPAPRVRRGTVGGERMPRKHLILAIAGGGGFLLLLIVLAAVWGPMKRSSQLSALDANLANPEEGRRLAREFAGDWGPRSDHVRGAITARRGPVEARIVLARLGGHFDLLADLITVEGANPKQQAEAMSALAEDWPDKDGPALPGQVASWIADPKADEQVAIAAAHLIAASNPPDAAKVLVAGTLAPGASDARVIACAESIARMVNRENGGGLGNLLDGLAGPHRSAIIGSNLVAETIKNQAGADQADRLLALLKDNAVQPIVLAGLAGMRMELGPDPAKRSAFAAKLAPMLDPGVDDAVLAGALKVVRRHQLIESRVQLIPLLPRLGKHQLPGLDGNDMAQIIGGLASDRNPALIAASNELVTALGERLSDDRSRLMAAGALAAVQVNSLPAMVPAIRELVGYPDEPVCSDAIAVLVGKLYGRMDLVAASKNRSWGLLLADGSRRQARYDAMRAWMKEHADDTTVRAGKERLTAAKEELTRYRDEIRGWGDAPPPLGLSKGDIDGLANQVNIMLEMVNKAWSGV